MRLLIHLPEADILIWLKGCWSQSQLLNQLHRSLQLTWAAVQVSSGSADAAVSSKLFKMCIAVPLFAKFVKNVLRPL